MVTFPQQEFVTPSQGLPIPVYIPHNPHMSLPWPLLGKKVQVTQLR